MAVGAVSGDQPGADLNLAVFSFAPIWTTSSPKPNDDDVFEKTTPSRFKADINLELRSCFLHRGFGAEEGCHKGDSSRAEHGMALAKPYKPQVKQSNKCGETDAATSQERPSLRGGMPNYGPNAASPRSPPEATHCKAVEMSRR